eukprot:CAMPEP_0175161654 /NCGR_PEP_ID=MMETSP0087-20121206/24724_1 /TAXON_ID=136419 /ORGANISM="Unknown Unknown, Strain D1" /LENGTH=1371 /DNA_ID=CAMNT_0016450091 /DNA_START=80 /DNA_END=4196 /DNA_ORIENTATION=-
MRGLVCFSLLFWAACSQNSQLPPTLDPIPVQAAIPQDSEKQNFTITGINSFPGSKTAAGTTVLASVTNSDVIELGKTVQTDDKAVVYFTPKETAYGKAVIIVTVFNDQLKSTSKAVEITISKGCEYSLWANWTACSKACNGTQTRSRSVLSGSDCKLKLQEEQNCGTDCSNNSSGSNNTGNNNSAGGNEAGSGGQKADDTPVPSKNDGIPTIAAIDSIKIVEDSGAQVFILKGISSGNSSSTEVMVTASSSDTSIVGQPSVTYTSPATNGLLSISPAAGKTGEAIMSITVINSHQKVTSTGFKITIVPKATPINCETAWNEWSDCSEVCNGTQSRTSRVKQPPSNNGQACPDPLPSESRSCDRPTCALKDLCTYGWTNWTDCSAQCGEGTQTRNQFIVRNSTSGKACERLKVETRQCFARTCAVADCQLEWSSWSACSKECGGGERIRSLVVTRLPGVGGKVCPNPLPTQTEMCNTQFCGCTVGPWGNWSICNRQCGLGAQRRARQVVGSEEACSLIIKEENRTCSLGPCAVTKSCEGRCGQMATGGGCACDSACSTYGDCCEDKARLCDTKATCKHKCGQKGTGECWCDSTCTKYRDCCEDFDVVCHIFQRDPASSCNNRCGASSRGTVSFSAPVTTSAAATTSVQGLSGFPSGFQIPKMVWDAKSSSFKAESIAGNQSTEAAAAAAKPGAVISNGFVYIPASGSSAATWLPLPSTRKASSDPVTGFGRFRGMPESRGFGISKTVSTSDAGFGLSKTDSRNHITSAVSVSQLDAATSTTQEPVSTNLPSFNWNTQGAVSWEQLVNSALTNTAPAMSSSLAVQFLQGGSVSSATNRPVLSYKCQCDDLCQFYSDCCADYRQLCHSTAQVAASQQVDCGSFTAKACVSRCASCVGAKPGATASDGRSCDTCTACSMYIPCVSSGPDCTSSTAKSCVSRCSRCTSSRGLAADGLSCSTCAGCTPFQSCGPKCASAEATACESRCALCLAKKSLVASDGKSCDTCSNCVPFVPCGLKSEAPDCSSYEAKVCQARCNPCSAGAAAAADGSSCSTCDVCSRFIVCSKPDCTTAPAQSCVNRCSRCAEAKPGALAADGSSCNTCSNCFAYVQCSLEAIAKAKDAEAVVNCNSFTALSCARRCSVCIGAGDGALASDGRSCDTCKDCSRFNSCAKPDCNSLASVACLNGAPVALWRDLELLLPMDRAVTLATTVSLLFLALALLPRQNLLHLPLLTAMPSAPRCAWQNVQFAMVSLPPLLWPLMEAAAPLALVVTNTRSASNLIVLLLPPMPVYCDVLVALTQVEKVLLPMAAVALLATLVLPSNLAFLIARLQKPKLVSQDAKSASTASPMQLLMGKAAIRAATAFLLFRVSQNLEQ